MILQLTDGLTTIALSGGSGVYLGCSYFPGTPTEAGTRVQRTQDEGEMLNGVRLQNVTDSAEVILEGTNTAIRAAGNAINIMLQNARNGQRAVYAEYDPHNGTPWRMRIYTGRVIWPTNPNRRRLDAATNTVAIQVVWERTPYLEGPEAELPISAYQQTAATGGRTVRNHNTATFGNWVQVANNLIGGDLPAPVRLELQNTSGSDLWYRNFYFSVNAYSTPATFTHFIQGEARRTGLGTIQGLGSASGGQYVQATFTSSYYLMWDLAAALVQVAAGRRFKLLARFAGFGPVGGGIYVQPELRDADGLTILWRGDELALPQSSTSAIIDLGRAMPLPPSGNAANSSPLVLALKFRCATSTTVQLDYIQLTPTDSYREIVQRATQVPDGDTVIDDSIENTAYWLESGTGNRYDVFAVPPQRLRIFPGVTNRIYILHDEGASSNISNQFTVRLYYRPRRLGV